MDALATEGLINSALECLFCGETCVRGAKHTCESLFFTLYLVDDSCQRLASRKQNQNDTKNRDEQHMRDMAGFILILGPRPAVPAAADGTILDATHVFAAPTRLAIPRKEDGSLHRGLFLAEVLRRGQLVSYYTGRRNRTNPTGNDPDLAVTWSKVVVKDVGGRLVKSDGVDAAAETRTVGMYW